MPTLLFMYGTLHPDRAPAEIAAAARRLTIIGPASIHGRLERLCVTDSDLRVYVSDWVSSETKILRDLGPSLNHLRTLICAICYSWLVQKTALCPFCIGAS